MPRWLHRWELRTWEVRFANRPVTVEYKTRFRPLLCQFGPAGPDSTRQRETVRYEICFPTAKSSRRNTCSQLFMGTVSYRWSVYPLGKESQNGTAFKYYSSQVGVPPVLNTDNSKSEIGGKWTDHCQQHCIKKTTKEPHYTWENPAEPNIWQLVSIVRNVMREFDVPLK